jgi:hypothetical protein
MKTAKQVEASCFVRFKAFKQIPAILRGTTGYVVRQDVDGGWVVVVNNGREVTEYLGIPSTWVKVQV